MGTKALIYVQSGDVSAGKQTTECLRYAMAHGWSFAIVPAGALREAVRLIREGQATLLLLAYGDEHLSEIVQAVEEAGGSVEVCHPGHAGRAPAGQVPDAMVIRMAEHGGTPEEIVRLLGVAEDRVRRILDRTRRRR